MASNNQNQGGNRGFAGMDANQQREIAAKGGRASHAQGSAHEFNSQEAREAGRKGGEAVSQDRQHMSDIGRKGGEASHGGGGNQGGGNRGGGFQAMSSAEQREIASKGGKASHGGGGDNR